jgi:hypothetical protein
VYRAERWENQERRAENIANALKEGVNRIDTWFEECTSELLAE